MRPNLSIFSSLAAALCFCAPMATATPATTMPMSAMPMQMKAMPRQTAVADQPVMCPAKLAAAPVAAAMPPRWHAGTWSLVLFGTSITSDASGQTLECDYRMSGSSGGAIVPLTARVPAGACVQASDKQSFLCVRGVMLN